jgi:hypothetical protein
MWWLLITFAKIWLLSMALTIFMVFAKNPARFLEGIWLFFIEPIINRGRELPRDISNAVGEYNKRQSARREYIKSLDMGYELTPFAIIWLSVAGFWALVFAGLWIAASFA